MPNGFELRPARAGEEDAIAAIWHTSASLPGVGPATMPTLNDLRQRVDVELAAGWVVTLAIRGGEAIGFLAINPREAVLNELFLRPDEIGSGLGRTLFEHATKAMPGGFTLITRAGNARARRFYERAGMVWLHDGVHPRNGDPVVHYGWSKTSTPD